MSRLRASQVGLSIVGFFLGIQGGVCCVGICWGGAILDIDRRNHSPRARHGPLREPLMALFPTGGKKLLCPVTE